MAKELDRLMTKIMKAQQLAKDKLDPNSELYKVLFRT